MQGAWIWVALVTALTVSLNSSQDAASLASQDGTFPPPFGNGCFDDYEACGCCLMKRLLETLESRVNESILALSKQVDSAIGLLNRLQANRAAFSASMSNASECITATRGNMSIPYKRIFVNHGNAYNASTGIFTAPMHGGYSFTFTVYYDAGSAGARTNIYAYLARNGEIIVAAHDDNTEDQEDSSTNSAILELNAGDKVSVRLGPGRMVCDDGLSGYNSFSGFLLYEM